MKKIIAAFLIGSATICLAQSAPPATAPSPGSGAGAQPPQYTPVRWNEDYLYLRKPQPQPDFFDPIKYIPFNDEGDWYLSLGGQARYRYEFFNNANFGAGPQDDDGFHLLRVMAHADLHLGPHFRGFVQGICALADGRTGGDRLNIDENRLDIHQGFGDVHLPFEGGSVTFRGGRQNLIYGAQRLISPLDWTNTRRTFDGGKISLAYPKNNTLDFFYVHPVFVDDAPLDSYNDNITFAGLYDTLLLPDLIKGAGTRLEGYALYLDNESAVFAQGTGEENRYTLGGRFYTNPKPWDFDVEAAYQFGDFDGGGGGGDISAWMFATEAGYTVADLPLTPRAFVGFDIASGDDDPGDDELGTFNQLFPLGHAYFGYIDVIGRQNILDLHPGLELILLQNASFARKLSIRADYHLFWRHSDDDALYGVASQIVRADNGSGAAYVGSEFDILINWQIDRHLAAYFGYSHFFPGSFIGDTGADEDIDFVYTGIQYTF